MRHEKECGIGRQGESLMRKKLISLLLTLVMAVGMVLTMSATAFAEPAVTIVTVAKGDTVTSICKKYGVDYYTYKKIIMALNCVSDESEFSKIKVGGQFVVPVSEAAAISLSNAAGSVTITGSTGAQTSGSTSTAKEPGLATQIPATDSVGYYIVSYTVESGDTINNIYKSWGLGYKTYTNQILGLNNISGFNKISVGKQLLLPTTVVATGTDVRYTVMKHVMKSGETVYNVVTSGYGLSYSANQEMLKLINGKDNLAAFKVGETLYIPVSGVVSISSDTAATK
jgi:LysM repeat protein